jgi:hypothetical protein
MAVIVKPSGSRSHSVKNRSHDYEMAKPEIAKRKEGGSEKSHRIGGFVMELTRGGEPAQKHAHQRDDFSRPALPNNLSSRDIVDAPIKDCMVHTPKTNFFDERIFKPSPTISHWEPAPAPKPVNLGGIFGSISRMFQTQNLQVLQDNLSLLSPTGIVSFAQLAQASANPNLPSEVRQAATNLLNNPTLLMRLDVAGGGERNGLFGAGNIEALKAELQNPPVRDHHMMR